MPLMQPNLNYPVDIRRRIDRKWQQRSARARSPARLSRQRLESSCPLCRRYVIAPVASVFRGSGLIHHHWLCTPCGYVWTTAVRMPA